MKMLLMGKDVWDIVDGSETIPEGASTETKQKFKKRSNLALSTICLAIHPSLQIYVRSAKDGKEAWDNLQNHFEQKTLSKKILYRRKLYNLRLDGSKDMEHHVNEVKTVAERLEALGDEVAEKDLV